MTSQLVAHTGQWTAPVVELVEYRTGPGGSRYALVELAGRYPSRVRIVERGLHELAVRAVGNPQNSVQAGPAAHTP